MDFIPPGLLKAAIGLAILVGIIFIFSTGIDYLRQNPLILILIVAVVGGAIYLLMKRNKARNRV